MRRETAPPRAPIQKRSWWAAITSRPIRTSKYLGRPARRAPPVAARAFVIARVLKTEALCSTSVLSAM